MAQQPWTVPDATVRYKVEIASQPTTPGRRTHRHFAPIPAPCPRARSSSTPAAAPTPRGDALEQSRYEGCAIVSPPAPGPFWIYLAACDRTRESLEAGFAFASQPAPLHQRRPREHPGCATSRERAASWRAGAHWPRADDCRCAKPLRPEHEFLLLLYRLDQCPRRW